ncbi:hypothetical protein B0A49_00812, partial [Cryomyces minteri]
MPQVVNPWLDSLDEDWISQPCSSSSPSLGSSTLSAASQSRIPRPSLRKSSGSSNRTPGRRRSVLTERSSSDGNLLAQATSTPHRSDSKSAMVGPPSQTFSTTSAHSVIRHGTMEQRLWSVSPKKTKDTPEWRRRIIKGQVGYGDQTDLFGPSGLENIFQQPARPQPPRPHSEAPPGLAHFGNGNNLPSSPPPWPSEVQLSSPGGAVQAFKTNLNLNLLKEEEAVMTSRGSLDSESDREATEVSTSTDVRRAARKPPLNYREPTVELPSIIEWSSLRDESGKACSPPESSGAVENLNPVKAFVEDSQSQTISSRVASGQTELRNEEFSPVYISKHNSTNGQIDYAPLDASSAQVAEKLKRLAIRHSEPDTSVLMARQQRDMQLDSSLLSHSKPTNGLDGHSTVDIPEISLPENLPAGTPDAVDM